MKPTNRRYPKFYERTLPIILGFLILVILSLLVITIAIAGGWIQFN